MKNRSQNKSYGVAAMAFSFLLGFLVSQIDFGWGRPAHAEEAAQQAKAFITPSASTPMQTLSRHDVYE